MRHKDETKVTAMYDAVITIMVQEGTQNLSVAKIAKRANISVATLYIYYHDKQDLLGHVYLRIKDMIDAELFREWDEHATVEQQFKTVVSHYAKALRQHPQEAVAMRLFNATPNLIAAAVYQTGMARGLPIERLFQRGVAEKTFRPVSFALFTAFVFRPFDAACETKFRQGDRLSAEESRQMLAMAWQASLAQ